MWLRAGEAGVALCVAPCAALSTLGWLALVISARRSAG